MEIISIHFALLVITTVFVFYLLPQKYRTGFLVLVSCGFIAAFNIYTLLYILIYSLINYFIGLKLPRVKLKKVLLWLGIIINISQLAALKYASFAIDPLFQAFGSSISLSRLSEIIVPIGISYFTLQGIGYLVNIKMGWEKPEKNYLNFLLYIIYYPKFLSGPIERSNHFLPQLTKPGSFNSKQVTDGLRIALFGFFKKIVIANQLGVFVNNVYADPGAFGGVNIWIIILVQPLYLYFDFSGYTDIAIGFSKMYGIDLLPNFNRPFLSENMTNFWKRFHMSLSLWFNDYIFKQVSFRYRKWGIYASVFAVFITFTLFGVWHGAGWTFMALGVVQALAINYEFFTKKVRSRTFSKLPGIYRVWAGRAFTYVFFGLSLVFFFSPDIETAFNFYKGIFNIDIRLYLGVHSKLAFLIGIMSLAIFMMIEVLYNDNPAKYVKIEKYWVGNRTFRFIVYYLIIALMVVQLGGNVSFIYQMF